MPQTIKNVVLAGASGHIGAPILSGLIASKAFTITVLTRASSTATFPADVKVIKVDYSSESSLVEAFKGQDAVVSAVTTPAVGDQLKIIDAAIKAGVKRFIPSDFGSDIANPKVLEVVPIFKGKVDVNQYLQSKESTGLSWTSLVNNNFFDWGLMVGFSLVDFKKKNVILLDPENPTATSATTLKKIGQAVAGILLHPEETKNRFVYVSSFTLTRLELHAAFEKVTGDKWTTSNLSTFDLEKSGHEKLGKGDMTGAYNLMQAGLFRSGLGADYGLYKSDNKLLELPEENLHEVLKEVLSSVA